MGRPQGIYEKLRFLLWRTCLKLTAPSLLRRLGPRASVVLGDTERCTLCPRLGRAFRPFRVSRNQYLPSRVFGFTLEKTTSCIHASHNVLLLLAITGMKKGKTQRRRTSERFDPLWFFHILKPATKAPNPSKAPSESLLSKQFP